MPFCYFVKNLRRSLPLGIARDHVNPRVEFGSKTLLTMADGSNNGVVNASAAVSIGNYKGVMLCNRPFNGVSSNLAKESRGASNNNDAIGSSSFMTAFLSGNPGEPIGMNVPILSEPGHAMKRDKKNTALSKHKKWHHDLQKERARLQQALAADDADKQKQKDRSGGLSLSHDGSG
ncbi:hypothetical protein FI667_g2697, partial [Globisporangium splendens]